MCRYCSPKSGQKQIAILESIECVAQVDKETPISRALNSATLTMMFSNGLRYKTFSAKIRFCPMCGKKLIRKV